MVLQEKLPLDLPIARRIATLQKPLPGIDALCLHSHEPTFHGSGSPTPDVLFASRHVSSTPFNRGHLQMRLRTTRPHPGFWVFGAGPFAPRLASRPAPERWTLPCGSTVWVLHHPRASFSPIHLRIYNFLQRVQPTPGSSSTLHWRCGDLPLNFS